MLSIILVSPGKGVAKEAAGLGSTLLSAVNSGNSEDETAVVVEDIMAFENFKVRKTAF